ncbi:hypothetical protein SPRG_11595 [Saprolegnia parasitica CBS 223.65]|uniref:Uncharacterized protein n=1 Tax=Saprolegnia parasitica (strain CBS 223.65) TaxID=695850 RepID=A0A067C8H2_SAPPC|nr:hypothetical protein SPRG_11595 [Saprolegnia parasitica CBS 223.65]KDO22836.1 hypothetical protein SPRG_11595 [Saprolegnia parasitica CBS 223.65]|eukprot:XP_012206507.1 hypothetical protein SPRG_11595 [Saprolegnia parasitica CBS 223.65]
MYTRCSSRSGSSAISSDVAWDSSGSTSPTVALRDALLFVSDAAARSIASPEQSTEFKLSTTPYELEVVLVFGASKAGCKIAATTDIALTAASLSCLSTDTSARLTSSAYLAVFGRPASLDASATIYPIALPRWLA